MRSLWRHNLASAIIAERLASVGLLDKDTAYTSGILHDIGRIALAVIQPKEYANLTGQRIVEARSASLRKSGSCSAGTTVRLDSN